jgi:hypothetical protein
MMNTLDSSIVELYSGESRYACDGVIFDATFSLHDEAVVYRSETQKTVFGPNLRLH